LGGEEYSSYSFTTSALDGSECSASRPGRAFTSGERTPGTHCTRGWVGPRAGLHTDARGNILCLCRGSNPDRPVVQPVELLIRLPGPEWPWKMNVVGIQSVPLKSCNLDILLGKLTNLSGTLHSFRVTVERMALTQGYRRLLPNTIIIIY
jgi:hypothetical protein